MLAWNIEGIKRNWREEGCKNYLKTFHLIGITETWTYLNPNLEGYISFTKKPEKGIGKGRRSGGIVVYVKKKWKENVKEITNEMKELLWIEFKMGKETYTIGIIYRMPDNTKYENRNFFDEMEEEINKIKGKNTKLIIAGDWNCRLGEEKDYFDLGDDKDPRVPKCAFRFRSQAPNVSATNDDVLDLDLISSHASFVEQRTSAPEEMGQKQSSLWSRPKISLTWVLKSDLPVISDTKSAKHSSQERKELQKTSNSQRQRELRQKKPSKMSELRKSEPPRHEGRRSVSPASSTSTGRPGRRRRPRRLRPPKTGSTFGYEIQDVDEFLTKASLDNPGNIPMVLSRPCVLYETHTGGSQREVSLPLGMVVNGVLKNRAWLYAQTPHGEEGYVPYACCLPLGILPAPSRPQPCWDTQTDIFPKPSGNRTDREKLRDETLSEYGLRTATNRKRIRSDSGERSVDGLYLRASRKPSTRHTLLVIGTDYRSSASNKLSVCKGDVVSLVSCHLNDWFWVRDRNGREGFIPAAVAGHGFF